MVQPFSTRMCNSCINKLRSTPSVEATIRLLDLSTYYDEDETKESVLQIKLKDLEERDFLLIFLFIHHPYKTIGILSSPS